MSVGAFLSGGLESVQSAFNYRGTDDSAVSPIGYTALIYAMVDLLSIIAFRSWLAPEYQV